MSVHVDKARRKRQPGPVDRFGRFAGELSDSGDFSVLYSDIRRKSGCACAVKHLRILNQKIKHHSLLKNRRGACCAGVCWGIRQAGKR